MFRCYLHIFQASVYNLYTPRVWFLLFKKKLRYEIMDPYTSSHILSGTDTYGVFILASIKVLNLFPLRSLLFPIKLPLFFYSGKYV